MKREELLLFIEKIQLDADAAFSRGKIELTDELEKYLTELRKQVMGN